MALSYRFCSANSTSRFQFLVGWGTNQMAGFGEEPGVKQQLLNLIRSVRTVMRSRFPMHIPSIFIV